MTKEETSLLIDKVLAGLDPAVVTKDYEYYASLYETDEEDLSEYELANTVSDYPDLHPKMIEIVERITDLIRTRKVSSMWISDEVQAGDVISYILARYDKKYCYVYAKSLAYQDLDHEVDQNEDIKQLIEAWGMCSEVGLVIAARVSNVGAWGEDLIQELSEEYGESLLEATRDHVEKLIKDGNDGSIYIAGELAKISIAGVPLLTSCIDYCEVDPSTARDKVVAAWRIHKLCPEILDLIVSCLLSDESGRFLFGKNYSLESYNPTFSELMADEANLNTFLSNIAKWLNSDVPKAKKVCEDLKLGSDAYLKEILSYTFAAVLKLEKEEAEAKADIFLKLFLAGQIPTANQI